eukprot:scaffold155510_cov18-Tisochrysis_lutea.AAC.2
MPPSPTQFTPSPLWKLSAPLFCPQQPRPAHSDPHSEQQSLTVLRPLGNLLLLLRSLMFWVDLLVAAPLDGIIAGAMGIEMRHEDTRAQYIALVRWLKVVGVAPPVSGVVVCVCSCTADFAVEEALS